MRSLHIYNPTAVKLLRTISETPGLTTTDLTRVAGSSFSTVMDYTRMMATMGLVRIAKTGIGVRYDLTPNGRQAIRFIEGIDELIAASTPEGVSWRAEC